MVYPSGEVETMIFRLSTDLNVARSGWFLHPGKLKQYVADGTGMLNGKFRMVYPSGEVETLQCGSNCAPPLRFRMVYPSGEVETVGG